MLYCEKGGDTMKIEIGESLFYSWLRHVKGCQIVQTNWKASTQWKQNNVEPLQEMMRVVDSYFYDKYHYGVFKGNATLKQLVQQGECDTLGIQLSDNEISTYAIDVAFHEAGLNYGDRKTTVMKVIEKCVRTAFCLNMFLDTNNAEIIFASPKINPAVLNDLEPCIDDLNNVFAAKGYEFTFCVIANEEFNTKVLQPILNASKGISDTAELFLRSYQMFTMFADAPIKNKNAIAIQPTAPATDTTHQDITPDMYPELKVGQLAQRVLGKMLCDGCADAEEIQAMQTPEYSKITFGLNYSLLAHKDCEFDTVRYYSNPININGEYYYLCSQWFETTANNDRPFLLKWIALHLK